MQSCLISGGNSYFMLSYVDQALGSDLVQRAPSEWWSLRCGGVAGPDLSYSGKSILFFFAFSSSFHFLCNILFTTSSLASCRHNVVFSTCLSPLSHAFGTFLWFSLVNIIFS